MTDPTTLVIPRDLLEQIYRQAREEYPNECCGWLSGEKDTDAVSIVKTCVNMQAQGQHPTAPSRSTETAYVFGVKDLMELNRSLDGDTPPRIIYHSHPNGHAYLSEIDRNVATSPWGDGPAYPVQQLVVGLDGQRVVEAALFAWSDDSEGFVEIAHFEGATI
jgi:proteasome lid subunit RPN8/RPN11